MVFLSIANFVKRSGYDRSFKKEKVFKLTAKYFGRKRNIYSIGIKFLQKALRYTTVSRKIKPQYLSQLRNTRINAACAEHDIEFYQLTQNLIKSGLNLNASNLQDLAIWEPRTFKCLTDIARTKMLLEVPPEVKERYPVPEGVITRGML